MADVPARELRNNVSGVLRRVEEGERLRVTVSGRPVAELVPLPERPRTMSWNAFVQGSESWRADPKLADELAALLPETTDDVPALSSGRSGGKPLETGLEDTTLFVAVETGQTAFRPPS